MSEIEQPGFTERELRSALGLFPTGVTVVTARPPGDELVGITVSSFNSVSLSPPLILFSVARNCHSLAGLLDADGFAVNVLRHGQSDVSNHFARAHGKTWGTVEHRSGATGSPLLRGAMATFDCRPHATYDGGDHLIFVGRVVELHTTGRPEPLVFFNGSYCELRPAFERAQPYDALMLHGW